MRPNFSLKPFLLGMLAAAACSRTPGAERPEGPGDPTLARTARGVAAQGISLEPVAVLNGSMPTGITVAKGGRMFLSFPRWSDPVKYTVAEIKDGEAVPYPNAEMNSGTPTDFAGKLVSVQSVVADSADRLWLVDTGNINFGPSAPGAAKLVEVDLASDKVLRSITFDSDIVLPTSYLNDIRIDRTRGAGGVAFITDSSNRGPNGIIVVDLGSGKAVRRLHNHYSTRPVPNFVPTVEGEKFLMRPRTGYAEPITIGSDGIALSADGKTLYYCPLASRHLYTVDATALADFTISDAAVNDTVRDLGEREFASDGLEMDQTGALYLTDYEHNAVWRRDLDGSMRMVTADPRLIWPDTLSVAPDGYMYVTSSQLNRQAAYNSGDDLRDPPYAVFRMKLTGQDRRAGL